MRDEAARAGAAPPHLQGEALEAYLDRFSKTGEPSVPAARLGRARGTGPPQPPRRRPRALCMEKGHDPVTVDDVQALGNEIRGEVAKAVVGHDDAVELMLIALFSSGHILLEGPPGTAKTFLTQCFARVLGLGFGRIQFTPDLMPGDILGSNLFNFQTSQFTLTRGPIFCQLLLADEINRTPPKTQAALLEAMQERRVTIDGQTHALPDHFMVIATRTDRAAGRLPRSRGAARPVPVQAHLMGYPSAEQEKRIVAGHGARFGAPSPRAWGIERRVEQAQCEPRWRPSRRCRWCPRWSITSSTWCAPRAARPISKAGRRRARRPSWPARRGRGRRSTGGLCHSDDVKALARPVLRHRVILSPAAEIEGRPVEASSAGSSKRSRPRVEDERLIYPTPHPGPARRRATARWH
jgi:MoxR-like ATPase